MHEINSVPIRIRLLILVLLIFAVAGPVWLALKQAQRSSEKSEIERVLGYARDVQSRTDTTTDQIANGIQRLKESNAPDPCSERQLALMRDIDLSSSYIQAIGYVYDDKMICSSLGATSKTQWSLGPVDFVSPRGFKIRTHVKLPFASNIEYGVVEDNGYAAIINKLLPIDATTAEKDVSLATFSQGNYQLYSSRGLIKTEWLQALGDQPYVTFSNGGYIVAVVRSAKYKTASLAALPTSYISKQMRELALMLVPIGLGGGMLLALALFYLARSQISMPGMLKSALNRHQLFMLYQPVVDLQTGACIGAEALVRWRQANGEMVRPDIFIPVAEESGLIHHITKRVLKLIGKDAAKLFETHPDFHLAVNLSATDFHHKNTIRLLHDLISETGARSGNIVIEATEHSLINTAMAKDMIRKMLANGFKVALDDFGTGYSSLAYLESFDFDYLKIDKSFVDKIGTEAPTSNVVSHIIEIAKEMNLIMIAEGVETEAQAQYLRERGVQLAQGWLFGKPMSLEAILDLID